MPIIDDPDKKKALLERMESQIVNAENKTSRIKACLYGHKGAGKSVLAVVLAKKLIKPGQSIIFVDTSEGWLSLRNHKDWGLLDGVQILPYESVEQLSVLAESAQRKIVLGSLDLSNVGAIVLDDADFMAQKELNLIWSARVKDGKSTLSDDKPERPDYLKLLARFGEIVEDIYTKTPDIHLLMTAHAAEKKTDTGIVIKTFPGFNPALSDELAGKQQIVAYLVAKEIKSPGSDVANYARTVQVHPSANVDAKTRVGFDRIRVPYLDFINTVVEWSIDGKTEDNEKEALKREIETKKIETDDESIATAEDDEPVFVG